MTADRPGILTEVGVGIILLGRFEVRLDGEAVPAAASSRRQAATLV